MVHHLKRGKALRETLTLTDLVCSVSQSSQQSYTSGESTDEGSPVWLDVLASPRSTCLTLGAQTGEPQRAEGARRATRHLSRSMGVFQAAHGRLREGCQGAWAGGQGDPNDTPRPSRRVGWGIGVCTQESWGHQEEDGRRRPRACAKRETKVVSERASCTRVDSRGTGAMGTDASWCSHGERSQVLSRIP